jgi:choline dehydrogenase
MVPGQMALIRAASQRCSSCLNGRQLMEPDYIVIGAGSAGCVLANRLSVKHDVLLLEAGGPSRNLLYRMPLAATKLWFNPKSSWMLMSEPEPGLCGRSIPVPRGKALGGSSAINGTVYNRGSPHDYDAWAKMGLKGWDYASLLPYFRSIEDHWRGGDVRHGAGGEVQVSPLRVRSPFHAPLLAAARQMGLPLSDDFIGEHSEGVGLSDFNVDRCGRRISAYDAFLHPIRTRRSLRIEIGAQVLRIIVEQGRAVGVEYLQHGQTKVVRARREVILSAGAIHSPHLLLLSGIGSAAELKALGITPVHNSPNVGCGLNDQPGGSFEFTVKQPLSFTRALRADRFAVSMMRWGLGLGGIGAGPPMVAMGALRTPLAGTSPDLRFVLAAGTMASKVWYPGITKASAHTLLMGFAVAHPESRGAVTLASANPLTPPRICYNLLTAPADMQQMKSYYRLLHTLIAQPAFGALVQDVTRPAAPVNDDTELEAYLRAFANTTSHPMGSCRMGIDAASVVDDHSKLRGIAGLRVVDASVFPGQISGNPHATVMMLAEKVSGIILDEASAR